MPGSEGGNEPMQLAVQRDLLENLTTVRLESCSKVVDIHSAQLRHHPVRDSGGNPAQPEVVDALLTPTADDVVALADLLDKHRDIGGIVLQVAIHGDDVLPARVIKSRGQSGSLPEVAAQFHHCHAAVDRGDLA